jgi:hypothetical protein
MNEMNDIYQRIQVAGETEDCRQILGILAEIQSGQLANDLKLVNYFREIPVSYRADILTLEPDSAELAVHQLQAVVIQLEKVTVLKSRHFQRDVIANVNYVNVEKSRIVLSSFSYALVRADRRMSVRVELSDSILATFNAEDVSVCGKLHDMSLTGVSIAVPEDPALPLSQAGELSVHLPSGTITVPASLLKTKQLASGCRLIFEIELTRITELNVSQYIFKRQVEIIKELKDTPGITQ